MVITVEGPNLRTPPYPFQARDLFCVVSCVESSHSHLSRTGASLRITQWMHCARDTLEYEQKDLVCTNRPFYSLLSLFFVYRSFYYYSCS
jgi:hypothetical protein